MDSEKWLRTVCVVTAHDACRMRQHVASERIENNIKKVILSYRPIRRAQGGGNFTATIACGRRFRGTRAKRRAEGYVPGRCHGVEAIR